MSWRKIDKAPKSVPQLCMLPSEYPNQVMCEYIATEHDEGWVYCDSLLRDMQEEYIHPTHYFDHEFNQSELFADVTLEDDGDICLDLYGIENTILSISVSESGGINYSSQLPGDRGNHDYVYAGGIFGSDLYKFLKESRR